LAAVNHLMSHIEKVHKLKRGQLGAKGDDGGLDCFTWNLYNSVFFSFTAVTTIGELKVSSKVKVFALNL